MTERPILFSGDMVRAILEGRKTQTRRPIAPQIPDWLAVRWPPPEGCAIEATFHDGKTYKLSCPHGVPGDRLYVRETWAETVDAHGGALVAYMADKTAYAMLAEEGGEGDVVGHEWQRRTPGLTWDEVRWRPSIHMPKLAARIWLEVVEVRVQRIQDIEACDVLAEGTRTDDDRGLCITHPLEWWDATTMQPFIELWDSIYEARGFGWDANPWVWALTFKQVQQRPEGA